MKANIPAAVSAIVSYDDHQWQSGNDLAVAVAELASATPSEILTFMNDAAVAWCNKSQYPNTCFTTQENGRPKFEWANSTKADAKDPPARQTYNIAMRKLYNQGIEIPGCRAERSDKGKAKKADAHSASEEDQIVARCAALPTWEGVQAVRNALNAMLKEAGIE
jgi:hypothetical protein